MSQLKKACCRAYQAVMGVCNRLMKWPGPELLTGPGAVERLPALIRGMGIDRTLLITGKVVPTLGILDGFLREAAAAGLECVMYSGARPDPTAENVEEACRAYREGACQAIVVVGGGSSMDCAKACGARIANPGRTVLQMKGLLKVRRPLPPLFAVPTTAGTGSETTITAVITDGAGGRKVTMNDPKLIPRVAVLDPTLTLGLPPDKTAATGLDALTHAVEAYTNRFYNSKDTRDKARAAVRLIGENLYTAYCTGDDLAARQNMLLASHYAGIAFTRACVGYAHAVGHTLGGLYHIPHGIAMAVLLPAVLRRYGSAVHGRLSELADELGLKGRTDAEKAQAFIAWMEDLKSKMGLPEKAPVIRDEDVEQMITWAMEEANPLYPVPVLWGREELAEIIAEISQQN